MRLLGGTQREIFERLNTDLASFMAVLGSFSDAYGPYKHTVDASRKIPIIGVRFRYLHHRLKCEASLYSRLRHEGTGWDVSSNLCHVHDVEMITPTAVASRKAFFQTYLSTFLSLRTAGRSVSRGVNAPGVGEVHEEMKSASKDAPGSIGSAHIVAPQTNICAVTTFREHGSQNITRRAR